MNWKVILSLFHCQFLVSDRLQICNSQIWQGVCFKGLNHSVVLITWCLLHDEYCCYFLYVFHNAQRIFHLWLCHSQKSMVVLHLLSPFWRCCCVVVSEWGVSLVDTFIQNQQSVINNGLIIQELHDAAFHTLKIFEISLTTCLAGLDSVFSW